MLRKIVGLFLLVGFLYPAFAQSADEYLERIDAKLRRDKRYLNLNYVDYQPAGQVDPLLLNIPRMYGKESFSFKSNENINYKIVFLKDAVGFDSIEVLYVDEITNKSAADTGRIFGGDQSGPQIDTLRVIAFSDMYNLKQNYQEYYNKFYSIIMRTLRDNPDNEPPTLLRINPDMDVKTSLGLSARDNTDYLNFVRANSIHWYPKPKVEKKAGKRASPTVVAPAAEYKIDASLANISFSHDFMNFSVGGASLETNFEDKLLMLLPWKSQQVSMGFRTLVSLSEKKEEIDNATVIDAKLLGRFALNTSKIGDNFVFGAASKLNLSNAAILDVSMTRPFGLPFINTYLAVGDGSFTSPSIKENGVAYFNFNSAEATMSFYWNASDQFVSRFRVDVGIGYYDIWRGFYIGSSNKPTRKELVQDNFYPVVQIYFNFSPEDKDLYGAKVRFFDNQAKISGWLKVLELEDGHIFRFEGTFVTAPIARQLRAWEGEGGVYASLRYRYGF